MSKKPKNWITRYPLSAKGTDSDYLQIKVISYTPNPVQRTDLGINEGGFFTGDLGFNLPSAQDRLDKLGDKKIDIIHTIILPVPQSIQDSNGVRWGSDELNPLAAAGLNAAGNITTANSATTLIENATKALSGITQIGAGGRNLANLYFGSRVVNALGGNTSFTGLISRTTGNVLNPNLELLFNGPTLRKFSFDYDLIPRNKEETILIQAIIRRLKRSMSAKTRAATESGPVAEGLFIGSPDIFQLSYKTGSVDHKFLHKFKPMALLNMSVNYTGSGTYATYRDSSPVHYKINLQFQELDPIYAEDYTDEADFNNASYTGGLGY